MDILELQNTHLNKTLDIAEDIISKLKDCLMDNIQIQA